ncbi:MAG: hypothetical protein VXW57_10525 [Pseudomonadota bacterium]|nr:hypothetical protein [Pseudomonadota bacterium]
MDTKARTEGRKRRAKRNLAAYRAAADAAGDGIMPPPRRTDGRRSEPAKDPRHVVAEGRILRPRFAAATPGEPVSRETTREQRRAALSPTQGYALGRAFDDGVIDAPRLDAGERYALAFVAYARVYGLPSGFPVATPIARLIKEEKTTESENRWREGKTPESFLLDAEERARRVRADYEAARAALSVAGHHARIAVENVALRDQGKQSRLGLWFGLGKLAAHYGLGVK